ncbi:MAG: hypothetical protein MJE68_16970 [Proteobacteria bacterium]|nr:hypothetical protein [Pseudomonadota bacterium]
MYTELENDNSCNFDDDEPLIQELNLGDVISHVPPELIEQEDPTPPEPPSRTEPASTLPEETAETI